MKKKLIYLNLLVIVLSFGLIFTACGKVDDGNPTVVNDLDLTQKIPVPVTGETPVFVWNGNQYSLVITWKDQDELILTGENAKFIGGEIYIAHAVINVKKGYTLNSLNNNSFKHYGATVYNFNTSTSTFTAAFPATVIPLYVNDFDLTNKVARAARGIVPSKSYFGSQYRLNISWKETISGTSLGEDDAFKPSTKYTAIASIIDTAWVWPEGNITFTHTYAEEIVFDPAAKTITIKFPETADTLDLSAKYVLEDTLPFDNNQRWDVSGPKMDLFKQARYLIFKCVASGLPFIPETPEVVLNSSVTGWSEQWLRFSPANVSAEEDDILYYVIDLAVLFGDGGAREQLMSMELYFAWRVRTSIKDVPNLYLVNSGDLNIPDSKWDIVKIGHNTLGGSTFTGAPANAIVGFLTRDMELVPKE